MEILAEYLNYSIVFLVKNTAKLLKYSGINDHAIKLEINKQPFIGLIYNLDAVELKMLKTYIKTNLAIGFIRPFKFSTKIPIFFD